ncbi:Bestrophin, RFP-TM, chloride channel-domain-containing protein [Phlebopus sp. FC_14]|nr:Bestrophin, RFP-TM, chloride channel-domain-containing protein [Phlebopus sp. FC_14]
MSYPEQVDANLGGVPTYPFELPPRSPFGSFVHAVLATAIFRCWHILIFFGAWSTMVCIVSNNVRSLAIQPTLITVFGTVLGFVISYRTTSSFERYNEGRRLWSQIVLGSRTFARTIWFHVPDNTMPSALEGISVDESRARTLIEKKTIINLLEAYAVAVKHYLRGEDGIFYTDLYPLVKFLPSYALPASIPSTADLPDSLKAGRISHCQEEHVPASPKSDRFTESVTQDKRTATSNLPLPSTTPGTRQTTFVEPSIRVNGRPQAAEKISTGPGDDSYLFPAQMPPKYSVFDLFPFSLLVHMLTKKGHDVKGRKAARLRAALRNRRGGSSHNVPLEISLYLSSYISALQSRKAAVDGPTISLLFSTLGQLVDALTGLERILTTPIPFSYAQNSSVSDLFSELLCRYSIHLWLVTVIYCLALPFQIWSALKWLAIPATVLASFAFFGFLVAGEEIESKLTPRFHAGYDKNDLNMDLFVHNIIRKELRAITTTPTPDPGVWAFSSENDLLFASRNEDERVAPIEWVRRGIPKMQEALALY